MRVVARWINRMGYGITDQSSIVSKYVAEIGEFSILSEEDEHELTASLRGEGKAKAIHKLVESNLPFVVRVASEFRNKGLPFEDLLNEGNVGLIEAAHHFDPSRGNRFITYAVWWIRKSILLALSRQTNVVRIPTYQIHKARQVRATEQALTRKLGRKPDREEISRQLQSTIAKIDKFLQVRQQPLSLDDKIGRDKDTPISDLLADPGEMNPEEKLLREESQARIHFALKHLSEQEQRVIIHRFGLQGGRALTLKQVGARLGITAERVRQIESRAMERMRRLIWQNPFSKATPPSTACPA